MQVGRSRARERERERERERPLLILAVTLRGPSLRQRLLARFPQRRNHPAAPSTLSTRRAGPPAAGGRPRALLHARRCAIISQCMEPTDATPSAVRPHPQPPRRACPPAAGEAVARTPALHRRRVASVGLHQRFFKSMIRDPIDSMEAFFDLAEKLPRRGRQLVPRHRRLKAVLATSRRQSPVLSLSSWRRAEPR